MRYEPPLWQPCTASNHPYDPLATIQRKRGCISEWPPTQLLGVIPSKLLVPALALVLLLLLLSSVMLWLHRRT